MGTTLTVQDIVSRVKDLPTIPAAALAVMREADSSTCTARSVADHISRDQALSARVLRLSNSAYYGLSRQVTDLQEAVVVLGMRSVRNLAVIAATYPWMSKPVSGYMLEPLAMWKHSFGVAVGSQLIAKKSAAADPDLAFTAGLLHNIGKVALSVWIDKKLAMMLNYANKDGLTFNEVERKIVGFDHCEIGAYLGEMWDLPPSLISPIRYHHEPSLCEPNSLVVDCVHVADFLTMMLGLGLGGDGLRYELDMRAIERLKISTEELDYLTADFIAAYENYTKLLEAMNVE